MFLTQYLVKLCRTQESIAKCVSAPASKTEQRLGVKRKPLILIPLDHVVIDELHLFLRISDVLLRNLIQQAVEIDMQQTRSTDQLKGPTLAIVVDCIHKCGVPFSVWESHDVKKAGKVGWSSLGGADKMKVLNTLPTYFHEFLPPSSQESVAKLWKVSKL